MTLVRTIRNLRHYRHILSQPVGGGIAFSVTGLTFLVLVLVTAGVPAAPGDPKYHQFYVLVGSGLLTAGAALRQREAGFWPFSVPCVKRAADTTVRGVTRLLRWPWRVFFWLGSVILGIFLAALVLSLLFVAAQIR